jgi:hypothetical protein
VSIRCARAIFPGSRITERSLRALAPSPARMVDTDPLTNAERETPIERADVEREIRRASAREHYKKVLRLLEEAGIGVTDSTLAHMLLHGCLKGRPSMIEAALDRGLPVDVPNHEGTTALHLAAVFGRNECVLLLLERGADVDRRRDDRRTALILAGQRGDADTMRLLVDQGADLDATAADRDRAVACAAYNGRWDSVDFLVSRGAAVEPDISTQQRPGVRLVPIIALLLEAGADPPPPGARTAARQSYSGPSGFEVLGSSRRYVGPISLRPRPRSDESP